MPPYARTDRSDREFWYGRLQSTSLCPPHDGEWEITAIFAFDLHSEPLQTMENPSQQNKLKINAFSQLTFFFVLFFLSL